MKIAISGTSATGKTSLAQALSKQLNVPIIEEDFTSVAKSIFYFSQVHSNERNEAKEAMLKTMQRWLNNRVEMALNYKDGFIADRWALDILVRFYKLSDFMADESTVIKLIKHTQMFSRQLDCVVMPPVVYMGSETINETGLHRKTRADSRIFSHAMAHGLLEEFIGVPKIYLPHTKMSIEERVAFIIQKIKK